MTINKVQIHKLTHYRVNLEDNCFSHGIFIKLYVSRVGRLGHLNVKTECGISNRFELSYKYNTFYR